MESVCRILKQQAALIDFALWERDPGNLVLACSVRGANLFQALSPENKWLSGIQRVRDHQGFGDRSPPEPLAQCEGMRRNKKQQTCPFIAAAIGI